MAEWEMNARKRGAEDDEINSEMDRKRASLATVGQTEGSAAQVMFKLLCPSAFSGAVLGKGGSIMAQASQTTGARIKLSQNREFYPGTNDRVLAISGGQPNVMAAVDELVQRIAEASDTKALGPDDSTPTVRGSYTLRVLIPSGAAGVMIGRAGSVIKQLSESTGCKMQLGESADPYNTKERIMIISCTTVAGLVHGVRCAVSQLFTEPGVAVYTNQRTTYTHLPTGPLPGLPMGGKIPSAFPPGGYSSRGDPAAYAYPQVDYSGGGGSAHHGTPQSYPYGVDPHYAPHATGYPPQQQQQYSAHATPSHYASSTPGASAYGNPLLGGGGPAPTVFVDTLHNVAPSPDITPPVYTTDGARVTMELGVADSKLGALLGRGGHIIKEIMAHCGSSIQISQKDQFIPGTSHRSVKASGTMEAVAATRTLIFAKLQEAAMTGGRK